MSRTLLMIRHGPTQENAEGIFMGRRDSDCLSESLSAASALQQQLDLPKHYHLYTSPLQRCLSTVKSAFPQRVPEIDDRLTERDLGNWSGQPKQKLQKIFPAAFLPSGRLDPYFTPEGGESLPTFCHRVASFLRTAATLGNENATIVVVSHNGVIRLTRYLLAGLPVEQIFSVGEPHLTPSKFDCDSSSNPSFEFRVQEICGDQPFEKI
jgi:broad specificity phosphatase PhoE